jgi:periplasmic protein TonB
MTQHADILDTRESLTGGFWASVLLHGSIFGIAMVYAFLGRAIPMGDPNAGGAAVGVEAVKSIPLAHQGPQNPVANDTQSQVPETPAPPVERKQIEKPPPPDAVALKSREEKKKPAKVASAPQRFRPYQQLEQNQLTTKAAPQVSTPLYSAQAGSGHVGTGANSSLGSRCGAYSAQIVNLVAQRWNTGDVDARYQTAPVVIVTFELARNGTVSHLAVLQRSGISALDFSAQRAIEDATPFPPLPACFDKDVAKVEFNFELKR